LSCLNSARFVRQVGNLRKLVKFEQNLHLTFFVDKKLMLRWCERHH
jgi:hypothetical protein